jgi:sugar lactone lactonase YvrE
LKIRCAKISCDGQRARRSRGQEDPVIDFSLVRNSLVISLLAACTQQPADSVRLPGDAFFPESVIAAKDGTLYVTSAITGEIAKVSPDRKHVTTFVGAESAQPMGKTGVMVDEAGHHLWACAIATDFSVASELREYDLATGALESKYTLNGGVCNDMVMDPAGNIYITDSFVGIERLRAGASAIDADWWSKGAALQPNNAADFANDGIVLDGSTLYVDNMEKGTLVSIAISASGDAGDEHVLTDPDGAALGLTAPDGMRLVAPGTLAVAESSADTVSKLVIDAEHGTATRAVLSDRIDRPSSLALVDGELWISEGQIFRAFGLDSTPVQTPFELVRAAL